MKDNGKQRKKYIAFLLCIFLSVISCIVGVGQSAKAWEAAVTDGTKVRLATPITDVELLDWFERKKASYDIVTVSMLVKVNYNITFIYNKSTDKYTLIATDFATFDTNKFENVRSDSLKELIQNLQWEDYQCDIYDSQGEKEIQLLLSEQSTYSSTATPVPTALSTATPTPAVSSTPVPQVTETPQTTPTPQPVITKKTPVITGKENITKTYSKKSFSLPVQIETDGGVYYKSSNTKVVSVSSAGRVSIKGYGKAFITVTTGETAQYQKRSKRFTITIIPKKVQNFKLATKTLSREKKILCQWSGDKTVKWCEIQLSEKKNFANPRLYTPKMSKKRYQFGVGKKKRYYIRMRSYIVVNGESYYSKWTVAKRSK